jgi:hypothetical protein
MILISHRGNTYGSFPLIENKPEYIDDTISLGFDVEVDVWMVDDTFYLGHDYPLYNITQHWLYERKNKLWIHCKNKEAFEWFNILSNTYNYFWHENDFGVLTSQGYIWSINIFKQGILVLPEKFDKHPIENTLGVCSDYILNYKK